MNVLLHSMFGVKMFEVLTNFDFSSNILGYRDMCIILSHNGSQIMIFIFNIADNPDAIEIWQNNNFVIILTQFYPGKTE